MTDERNAELAALNAQVRFVLTGDDGSCFGEGGLERTERIKQSLLSIFWSNGERFQQVRPYPSNYESWCQRAGKSWQAKLEAYVSAYREPAPEYCQDIVLVPKLMIALQESIEKVCGHCDFEILLSYSPNLEWGLHCYDHEHDCQGICTDSGDTIFEYYFDTYKTMGEAIVRAFLSIAKTEVNNGG